MESIKDKVAIVGMGCTKFGELFDKSSSDLIVEATKEAVEDAGIELKDIQAAWVGTAFSGEVGTCLSVPLRLQYIPVTRVENRCCTGSDAIRNAAYAVASGAYDIVLALGYEKQKDTGFAGTSMGGPELHPVFYQRTALSTFALRATSYFARYGLSPEEGKTMIAKIAVKSRRQGALSPKAHFQREITLEEALNSPIVCWPLSLTDCCPVTDGAAAVILTRADMARSFSDDYMLIKALGEASGPGADYGSDEFDLSHFEEVCRAAQDAYRQAGIKNPIDEVSLAQCHDCFSITEAILYEDLGFCPRGQAKAYVDEGVFEANGKMPMNTDGGLISFGHPIGASGIRQAYEMYKQFQGKADSRQLKEPRIGLCENFGGGYGAWSAIVNIYGRRD